jgi:hypothetical protein
MRSDTALGSRRPPNPSDPVRVSPSAGEGRFERQQPDTARRGADPPHPRASFAQALFAGGGRRAAADAAGRRLQHHVVPNSFDQFHVNPVASDRDVEQVAVERSAPSPGTRRSLGPVSRKPPFAGGTTGRADAALRSTMWFAELL